MSDIALKGLAIHRLILFLVFRRDPGVDVPFSALGGLIGRALISRLAIVTIAIDQSELPLWAAVEVEPVAPCL